MSKVLIIGGGAAGMMAGVFAARNHHEVHILEKNEKLGKKVFITGKGRCNVANACDILLHFSRSSGSSLLFSEVLLNTYDISYLSPHFVLL